MAPPPTRISHYRIQRPLGRGGMGEVYAGVDETLKRPVALKAIRVEHRFDPQAKARFLREAQLLSQLDHPHVCRVYDYIEGTDSDWLVLELIEGRNLRAAIDAGLDRAEKLRIAEQVAQVLILAHAAGIVHRDLKPGNVMVGRDGQVKVLDFGVARSLPREGELPADSSAGGNRPAHDGGSPAPAGRAQQGAAASSHDDETQVHATGAWVPGGWGAVRDSGDGAHVATEQGVVLGTVAYMSPEQARGEPATPASDMYSFGLLLQELFTGRAPYDRHADHVTLLERVRRGETDAPAGIEGDVAALVTRLTSLAPSRRPTALDTLERLRWIRDKRRRRARRLAAAGALVAAVLAAAKYTTDLARERTAAVQAHAEADRRRAQAEDLIGFMLGDLRTKLEAVGRLEILDEVGGKAMDYFEAVPESALSDEELLSRSKALYQVGTVRISRGQLEAATGPLQESLALAETLVERQPGDPSRLFALGQSHFWAGYVHWRRRNLPVALEHFEAYLDLSQQLVGMDGRNADWQLELSSANSNIGSVLQEQGNLEGALARFRASLAIDRSLLERAPADTTLKRSAAASHNTVGVVLRSLGRLDEALHNHRAELALQEELVAQEPGTAQWRLYHAVSQEYVAGILEARGEVVRALDLLKSAQATFEALATSDPTNMEWQRELGINQFRLGAALGASGDTRRALGAARRAVAILERTAATEASDAGWQRDFAEANNGLARLLAATGDGAGATRAASAALDTVNRLLEQSPDDRSASRLRSTSLILLGEQWAEGGHPARAADAWSQAITTLEPVARDSQDSQVLAPYALALMHLGRLGDAQAVVQRLGRIGYRHPTLVRVATRRGLSWPAAPRPAAR